MHERPESHTADRGLVVELDKEVRRRWVAFSVATASAAAAMH
jgi:hypothetical protein